MEGERDGERERETETEVSCLGGMQLHSRVSVLWDRKRESQRGGR